MSDPIIIRNERALRGQVWEWRGAGETIGFAPTMGALHHGHLTLVTLAQQHASKTIASIFVNPTQFAPGEDFESYPRTEKDDIAKLASVGCDLIYIPERGSMYDAEHSTSIKVGGVADTLETDHRPTFFDGVALVVTKLLNRAAPDIAVFGEKDYQQLATIQRMVTDLDMPIKIIGAPIARDDQGLALSSRNQYFDESGLALAQQVNVIMRDCARELASGMDVAAATQKAKQLYLKAGFESVDYVTAAHASSLEKIETGKITDPARLLIALHCRGVRLIDNCAI